MRVFSAISGPVVDAFPFLLPKRHDKVKDSNEREVILRAGSGLHLGTEEGGGQPEGQDATRL
jgi:hypothetical protein